MLESKKTFWPYGILISIFAIVVACVATIIVASNYPVYEDDFYFDSYQNVENNYNIIQKQQEQFDTLFKVEFQNDKIDFIGKRKIASYTISADSYLAQFKITALNDQANIQNLKSEILLTRPHTREFDQKLLGQIQDGVLSVSLPQLEKGRWQLKIKLSTDDEITGFFSYELNAQ
ncbi:TPA: FixH family protein [Campylobacter coli]|nr:FixH family protein [Campylobacter coli]